jgi:hypothetical protein
MAFGIRPLELQRPLKGGQSSLCNKGGKSARVHSQGRLFFEEGVVKG